MGICMNGLDLPGRQAAGSTRHKELWTLVQLAQDLGRHNNEHTWPLSSPRLIEEERGVLAFQVRPKKVAQALAWASTTS